MNTKIKTKLLIIVIILYVILSFIVVIKSYGVEYKLDGFGDIKWGQAPIKGMELLDKRGRFSFYSYDGDNSVGGFATKRVSYKFCNNQLCAVAGAIEGDYETFQNLHNLFIAYYGIPNSYDPYHWFWFGETNIMLCYEDTDKTGYFYYYYVPIHAAILHERAKQLEEQKKLEDRLTHPKGIKDGTKNSKKRTIQTK